MSDIQKAKTEFIDAIRNTEEYLCFQQQLHRVKQVPMLKEQIDEFRVKNFTLQKSEQGEDLLEKMEHFQNEYATFQDDPIVNDFLQAELSFCRMMQDIYEDLAIAVNFD